MYNNNVLCNILSGPTRHTENGIQTLDTLYSLCKNVHILQCIIKTIENVSRLYKSIPIIKEKTI